MLLISTRLQYGLLALLCIAQNKEKKPLALKVISKRLKISLKYLERIFSLLKKAGLVKSIRGPEGGYYLILKPENINLLEVLKALERKLISIECLKKENLCKNKTGCPEYYLWRDFEKVISDFLKSKSLKDLLTYKGLVKLKSLNLPQKINMHGGHKNVKKASLL